MGTATVLNTSRGIPRVFSSFGWTSKTCHFVQGSILCKAFSAFSTSKTPSNCFTISPDSTEKSSLKRAYFTRATVPAFTVRETQAVLFGLSLMGRVIMIVSVPLSLVVFFDCPISHDKYLTLYFLFWNGIFFNSPFLFTIIL